MRKVKLSNPFKTRIIDEKIIREHLALERTKLANERTLLSYIRASLYLLLGGLALFQIKEYDHVQWIGYLSLFISAVFIAIGISRYVILDRKLHKLLRPDDDEEEKPKRTSENKNSTS